MEGQVMTLAKIRKAYRETYRIHLDNIAAYEAGGEFKPVAATALELHRLRALLIIAKECP
jgi:hypothetical protein